MNKVGPSVFFPELTKTNNFSQKSDGGQKVYLQLTTGVLATSLLIFYFFNI